MAVEFAGQISGTLQRAVGDQNAFHAMALQMTGGQLGHFTGADQHHGLVAQAAEDTLCQFHGTGGDVHRLLADLGFRTRAFGCLEGGLIQAMQNMSGSSRSQCMFISRFHLTEDLRLAEHQRIKPGGHAEQMVDRCLGGVGIKVVDDLCQRHAAGIRKPLVHQCDTGIRVVRHQCELDAVAGGQHGCFADRLVTDHALQQGRNVGLVDGSTLAQLHRSRAMIQSNMTDAHGAAA